MIIESFIYPVFKDKKCIEFRVHNNIACIYGNVDGLVFLKDIFYDISKKKDEYFILLNKDCNLITDLSIDCNLQLDIKQYSNKNCNIFTRISKSANYFRKDNGFYTLNFQERDKVLHVYGTPKGFHLMGDVCDSLINHPKQGHVHLENECYPLKSVSLNAVISIF